MAGFWIKKFPSQIRENHFGGFFSLLFLCGGLHSGAGDFGGQGRRPDFIMVNTLPVEGSEGENTIESLEGAKAAGAD